MAVLTFEAVVKRFGAFTAVDSLSFEVPEGGVFGFLGANGAGKTTSLRMALDILRPTAGRIEVLGRAPGREQAPMIGFLPEERGLYRQMSVAGVISYFGRLKGLSGAAASSAATELVERLDLGEWVRKPVASLSKGMSQKVQLATALVNAPRLLLLDEPFSGLDPVNQAMLEDLVRDAAAGGATVVFSTHVMAHAERLCDRLLLLSAGKSVFQGTVGEARNLLPARLRVTARGAPDRLAGVVRAAAVRTQADGWTDYEVALAPGADPGDVLEACTANGFPLRAFQVERASLHEVFLHLVGGQSGVAA
ncbi:MAG: ATP-binding cassette domain-containing protein [Caulobacteraceae bacterium]|nr:ATP-binding cassette domain-containing protein [Caulobacteraceae bacterium]